MCHCRHRQWEPPVAEDELVYQPGFKALTEEDKKKKAEEDKKRAERKAADDKKRAEDKVAADKRKRLPCIQYIID